MNESFPHLRIQREETITEKRPRTYRGAKPPKDPKSYAQILQQSLVSARTQADEDEGGFDERKLFRFNVEKGFDPDLLQKFSNEIEVISQEGEDVVVAFVTSAALESFESRLVSLAKGKHVTYQQVLFALKSFQAWMPEDRTGWALKREGFPNVSEFLLDVELWPLEDRSEERKQLWDNFELWLKEQKIVSIDSVKQPGLTLYRVRCNLTQAEKLRHHRDVRTLDLPPTYSLDLDHLYANIQDFPEPAPPPKDAPGLTVLDSGLNTGHPLLASSVGDAKSFLPDKDPTDKNGHGTHVAGLALFGDVEEALSQGQFLPTLRLFSGRILNENNQNDTGFVEKQIAEAVQYFNGAYGCKVFNLSLGDRNKPYLGGHVKGLSYTLDSLSREFGVLFVVSAGNVLGNMQNGLLWKDNYPKYLSSENWAILEPAPALNALTVGSLARYDQTVSSQRYSTDPAEIPIARRDQPSPFSRHGSSVGGAIKPELVAYGGNWALNTRGGANYLVHRGLGEISTSKEFATGKLFAEKSGTSMATPHVAHLAANLLTEHPDAEPNLLRALLVAHATIPDATWQLFREDVDAMRQICGYGRVNQRALLRSIENEATLIALDAISNKKHHFYEIPITPEFTSSGRRLREITVALAHTPYVRSTRIAYKSTRIDFKLVVATDLDRVSTMFNRATEKDDYENIPELNKPDISSTVRNKGTVQVATWQFRQFSPNSKLKNNRLFVVVTRHDFPWAEPYTKENESYALVVCMRDRENEQAQLYSEIRNRLQTRVRAKART